jgi:ketosteroid isomerase-like protein
VTDRKPRGTGDAAEDEVRAAERALYVAQVASDVEAIAPMLDEDLVYIHSTGVAESKDEYLAGVRDRLYEYGTIGSRGVQVEAAGSLAVMHGIVDMTVGAHAARKELIHLLFCLVWRRSKGRWRLAFRQATRLHGSPGQRFEHPQRQPQERSA